TKASKSSSYALRGFPAAVFVENGRGRRRAAAARAELPDANQPVEIADASRRLDLHARRAVRPHQREIVLGRALVVVTAAGLLDEAVAGGGFDPIRAGPLADLTQFDLEFVARQARPAAR